ncbi:ras guanine nucleotide exchange factor domain-containing protein, partial [Gilbertella persicaria]|uniref:ras guanine nucleotide exchange factor domain-containing protein n=1 Tax=Gilbertella persicaria TaxID=101096 RepID=UPI00221F60DB
MTENIQSLLNKVQNIHISATTVPTILQFQPVLIAYQLTLIDSAIFRNIPIDAILSHAPKTPHPAIVASTDFFNYLTRLIEHSILLEQEACRRAQQINHWIKVASKCHELKNYQTLKAVISALGTPPIQRLKRSWAFIPKKSMVQLEELSELMSEASNYGRYRERLGLSRNTRKNSFSEPTVPFLGIFIHDVTYLVAAISKKKQQGSNSWKKKQDQTLEILKQDNRVSELLKLFKNFQRSPSYSPNLTHTCLKDLYKTKRRKISQALARTSPIKKVNFYLPFDDSQLSIELQQCLVTQYLLTRSWVSEKAVDELSLVREPTKT